MYIYIYIYNISIYIYVYIYIHIICVCVRTHAHTRTHTQTHTHTHSDTHTHTHTRGSTRKQDGRRRDEGEESTRQPLQPLLQDVAHDSQARDVVDDGVVAPDTSPRDGPYR